MIRRETQPCFVAECDGCNNTLGTFDHDFTHFENQLDARAGLLDMDWQIAPDGKVSCATCLDEEDA